MPPAPRLPPGQINGHSPDPPDTTSRFHLRPACQTLAGRLRSESILSPLCLQLPDIPKPRSSSLSELGQSEARHIDAHAKTGGAWAYTATHPGHSVLNLQLPPYLDRPPHQDVAIQHICYEPEASMQTDWIDNQLLGRVIELSTDCSLHRRTMVVMAVTTCARFLQGVHICRHPEILENSAEFHETHIAVVGRPRGEEQPIQGKVAVVISHPEIYALRTYCYINPQHVWTVRRDVMFRNIGLVDDFQRLKEGFRDAQKRLYEDKSSLGTSERA